MHNNLSVGNLMKTYQIRGLVFSIFLILSIGINLYASETPPKKFVVVLDPGHGGKDSGNTGNGFSEKNIALKIALTVGAELEKHKDIEVIYTRKTDVFIGLDERARIANDAKANLFVSIHMNSFRLSGPHGTETYVLGTHRNQENLDIAMKENSVIYLEDDFEETYDGFDPESPTSYIGMTLMQEEYLDQSILLADYIQKEFTNKLKRFDRGVKKAGFLVLAKTYMPSVLVEAGFLTNLSEGRYLNSAKGQKEIASSIVQGIKLYKDILNLESGEVELAASEVEVDAYNGIEFKVQIGAGTNPLEPVPHNFKGLRGIERKKEGDLYKYYYGKTSDYLEIQNLQREAQDKGYSASFIVAFKEGSKLSIDEALKNKAQ